MPTTPETFYFSESNTIPNHPDYPVIVYRDAIDSKGDSLADQFESHYSENGWGGNWRWSVYDFHHYHSNAHEVLGVSSGEATLKLGGPDGKTVKVKAGDVIILPAGTGHKNEGSSRDFQVVGAYPAGQENKDLIRDDQPYDDTIKERIRETPLPEKDPIFGDEGSLLNEWS